MSWGGYRALDKRLYAEKWEAKIREAIEAGMSEEDARCTLSPPSPIHRHERFKEGHKRKGEYTTKAAQVIGEKIDSLVQKKARGEFVESGRNDILKAALEKDEHPGRVRGEGSRARIKTCFGASASKQQVARTDHGECKKYIGRLESLIMNVYSNLGIQLPDDVTSKMVSSKSIESHKGIPNMQPLLKKTSDKEVVRGKSMLSISPSKEPTPISPSKEPTPIGDFDDGMKCKLLVEDPVRRIVGIAKMYNFQKHHGRDVPNDTVKIVVDEVYDDEASLPHPEEEALTLAEAKELFILWPKKLIEVLMDHDEVEKECHKVQKTNFNDGEVKNTKSKDSKIDPFPSLEKDQLPTFDPNKLPTICMQLYSIIDLVPDDKVAKLQMTNFMVGREYDFFLSKENIMDFLTMDELDVSCIQVFLKVVHYMTLVKKHNWISLLCPALIQKVGMTETERVIYIAQKMRNGKKIYLAPFFEGSHWMLCVIKPKDMVAYWFDPLWRAPRPEWYKLLSRAIVAYQVSLKIPPEQHEFLDWKEMHYHKQLGDKNCGYYIMAYMREIAFMDNCDIDFVSHFKEVSRPYTQRELDVVRELWASYFMRSELTNLLKKDAVQLK